MDLARPVDREAVFNLSPSLRGGLQIGCRNPAKKTNMVDFRDLLMGGPAVLRSHVGRRASCSFWVRPTGQNRRSLSREARKSLHWSPLEARALWKARGQRRFFSCFRLAFMT